MARREQSLETIEKELNHLRRLARWMEDLEAADEMHKSLNVCFRAVAEAKAEGDAEGLAERLAA